MNWVPLALLAPLFWVGSNFIDKYLLGKHTKGIYDFLFFSTISSFPFFVGLVLFLGLPQLTYYSIIPVILGMVLIYSYGFYGKAIEQGETSTLVISFKLIPVFTLILALLFLGQTITGLELVAFILVLVGAIVVSLERESGGFLFTKGAGWILVAIMMWSVMFLFADYALEKMPFWDFFILDTLGSAIAGIPFLFFPGIRNQVIHGLRTASLSKYEWFIGNNLFDFLGQMSMKKSLSLAPSAGLVTVAIQVQSLYAIVLGVVLTILFPHVTKENISRNHVLKKIIGAAVMFLGIYLLF